MRRRRRSQRVLGRHFILLVMTVCAVAVPCRADTSARVRGASAKESRLIGDLLARSGTARALVGEIEATDLIVYVQLSGNQPAGRGATTLASSSEQFRYVRIVIGAMTHPSDRGALLAHELQHALEIGREKDVRDERGIRQLYERIGEDSRARFVFETTAARDVGSRVLQELTARGTGPREIARR